MYTLEDYLLFRGDIGFEVSPVNEIDEMVFAALGKAKFGSVLDFARDDEQDIIAGFRSNKPVKYKDVFSVYFRKCGRQIDKSFGLLESPVLMRTLLAVASSPRYKDVEICSFVNKFSTGNTEQMCALTVLPPDGKIYVTFRGTDDTLIGWKENCELAVRDSVPAQRDAAEYLARIAEQYSGQIVVLGHSKGGNLAVYAAANAEEAVQDRIQKVISYDGPGFRDEFLGSSGYKRIKHKIVTLVPRASIVGMLMDYAGELDVIECGSDGPRAHDIFIWNLDPSGFVRASELSEKTVVFRDAINQTLARMNMEERQLMINEIFDSLESIGADELLDLTEQPLPQIMKLIARLSTGKETKQFLMTLSRLSLKGTFHALGNR